MKFDYISLIFAFFGSVAVIAGDALAKQWAVTNSLIFILIASIFYIASIFLFIATLRKKMLAVASALFSAITIPVLALIGTLYFKEVLSINLIIAVILVIIAVFISES